MKLNTHNTHLVLQTESDGQVHQGFLVRDQPLLKSQHVGLRVCEGGGA